MPETLEYAPPPSRRKPTFYLPLLSLMCGLLGLPAVWASLLLCDGLAIRISDKVGVVVLFGGGVAALIFTVIAAMRVYLVGRPGDRIVALAGIVLAGAWVLLLLLAIVSSW